MRRYLVSVAFVALAAATGIDTAPAQNRLGVDQGPADPRIILRQLEKERRELDADHERQVRCEHQQTTGQPASTATVACAPGDNAQ